MWHTPSFMIPISTRQKSAYDSQSDYADFFLLNPIGEIGS